MSYEEGVSIIIPIYNAEDFLKNCLQSVKKQSYKNLEIICVLDSKSDDTSEKIVTNFKRDDKRVILIKDTTGKGAGYCRNLGIEAATKEYIGFVDADDFVDKDYYERLYDFAKIFDADVVQGEMQIVDDEKQTVVEEHKYSIQAQYSMSKIYSKMKEGGCTDKIFKTEVIKGSSPIRFGDTQFFESYPFVLSALKKANKLVTTTGSFYYWIRHPESMSMQPELFSTQQEDSSRVLKDIFEILVRANSSKEDNRIIIKFMIEKFGMETVQNPKYSAILAKTIEKLIK